MKDYLNIVNEKYPIRNEDKEKKEFQDFVLDELKDSKYNVSVQNLQKKHKNIVIGNVEKASVVFTAHYDTPATALYPNLVMPRRPVLTMLYHFAFPIAMALLSLFITYLLCLASGVSEIIAMIFYLDIYFMMFLLCTFAFKNKNNKNDNTSGVACVLELAKMNERDDIAFILFDNEEKGLLGSKAFNKANKNIMKDKLVINMDCVGLGKNVLFIAQKDAMKNDNYAFLKDCVRSNEEFNVEFYPVKGSMGNSDYKSFKCGVGVMVCEENKLGYFTSKIHTNKDTVADKENIEFLVNELNKFIMKL